MTRSHHTVLVTLALFWISVVSVYCFSSPGSVPCSLRRLPKCSSSNSRQLFNDKNPTKPRPGTPKYIPRSRYHPSQRLWTSGGTTTMTTTMHPSSTSLLLSEDLTPSSSSSSDTRVTAVYALIFFNLLVFGIDKVFRYPFVARHLYLFHRRWKWWQPLTSCFCHTDRVHLSNNLFLLLLFGRSVEDDQGWVGLLVSYIFCGVTASLVSLALLPKYTVSIGASGAVFGLFAVSTLAKLSWRDIDWRKLVEVAVLGEFVFRQLASEISTAAGGGHAGVNHVAHLSGAAAGAILVLGMRATVANFDRAEQSKLQKKNGDSKSKASKKNQ